MDDKSAAKHRSKIIQNGLGGATNTPNSQVEQPNSSSSIDATMIPNSLKRRASVDIPSSSKPKTSKKEMPKGQDLVDRIWLEIDNQQREKREKQAIRKAAEEAIKSHEPIEPFCLELTASNLKSLQHDDTLAKKFIQHETMVDKLLGYKMLLGRMENYSTLGYVKMRENNDDSPRARAQRDGVYGRSPSPQIFRRGPRTPPEENEQEQKPVIIQKRGPKTPPGSPGPSTPPPQNNERHRLLIHMAQVTGASIEQVEITCGDALNRAIDNNNINKLEMLETFKTALISMANRHVPSHNSTPMKYKMCSLSDQMELVSDATLSASPPSSPNPLHFAPLTAPPIPPPMLPMVPLQTLPQIVPQPPNSFSLPPMSIPPPPIGLPPSQHSSMICRPPPPPIHLPPPPIMPAMNIPPPPIVRSQNILPPLPPQQQQQKPKVELKSIVTVMPEHIPTVRVMPQWMNQPPPPIPPPIPPPNYPSQQSGISSHNVQNTLFSALGIAGKDSFLSAPPPPPPPIDSSSNIPNTSNIRSHYGNNNGGNTPNFKKGPPPPRFFF
ncbi:unnamed protein product [Caenorhabditis angaria]|uniref:Uncharacterized protein n=1 Tax=Caenorhabditis angaria TaxID=860376 RepID=A0A9P1I5J0_9PELO|nr:unnamed protein product [Caenorhabditis angaria]